MCPCKARCDSLRKASTVIFVEMIPLHVLYQDSLCDVPCCSIVLRQHYSTVHAVELEEIVVVEQPDKCPGHIWAPEYRTTNNKRRIVRRTVLLNIHRMLSVPFDNRLWVELAREQFFGIFVSSHQWLVLEMSTNVSPSAWSMNFVVV